MHARYFSAHLGKFHSIDPVGVAVDWPQSWNRYTYVLGIPVKYVDPYGLVPLSFYPFDQIPLGSFDDAITVTGTNVSLFFSVLGLLSGPGSSTSGGFFAVGGGGAPQRPTTSMSSRGQPNCANAPQAPPGVAIERNLALVGWTRILFGIDDSTRLVAAASAPGSAWDFKARHGASYENFGNFHFGAASAAAGIPQGMALRGAGLVQIAFSRTQYDWLYSQGPTLLPGLNPPFGDDPGDQAQIRLGYFWYENCP